MSLFPKKVEYPFNFEWTKMHYLDPPVACSAVIHSYCAIGQSIAKPATVHVTKRCDCLIETKQRLT